MKKVLILPNFKSQCLEYLARGCVAAGLSPTFSDTVTDPSLYDGLILPGGGDISPRFYNEPDKHCEGVSFVFDQLEYRVLDAFVKADKPVLGICRGMQFINVYFGGTLFQDIDGHRMTDGGLHKVITVPHASYARVFNHEMMVNSTHHQAVKTLGEGLEVFAKAEDGTVEGINHVNNKIIGVQWHPERALDDGMDKSGGVYVFKLFSAIMSQE